MKKALVLFLSFLFMSGAFASKARLISLGDDKDGSFFIDDFRNIFLNAAYVNNHKNQVFLESGSTGNTFNLDSDDNNQKAMGGFLMSSGNLVYGLYLGNESDTDILLRTTAWNTGGTLNPVDNVTDFFIGGEAGDIKWGANVLYSKNEDTSKKQEDERYALRLGMMMGEIEAFANISLGNEATDSNAGTTANTELKFDGKMGYHVGGSYRIGDFTPYVSYKDGTWDNKDGTTTTEGSFTEIKVGVGHTKNISSTSRIFTRINYFSEEVELKYAAGAAKAELKRVPLTLGFESDATSWLTLRGSISTNLMGDRKTENLANVVNATSKILVTSRYNGAVNDTVNRDETLQNTTVVSTGATLKFGKLSIDGLLGTTGSAGTSTTSSKVGALALDRLMTRVAMTYSF